MIITEKIDANKKKIDWILCIITFLAKINNIK